MSRLGFSVLCFLYYFFIQFSQPAQAEEFWTASEGAIKIACIHSWSKLPTDSEINQAYSEYAAKLPKHVQITSPPKKMSCPWWTTPNEANIVFITERINYSLPLKTVERAIALQWKWENSKWTFSAITLYGTKRYPGDKNTASDMHPKDLVYLKEGWINSTSNPGGPQPPPPPPPPPPQTNSPKGWKIPCKEAQLKFQVPNAPHPNLAYDYNDLMKQIDGAIEKYEAETSQAVYVEDNVMGTLPALSWLFNQGGLLNSLSKKFVCTNDEQRAKWSKKRPRDTEVPLGNELSLYNNIFHYSRSLKRKLNPGDLVYLSLKETNGDIKTGLLMAHNVLRSLSRMIDRTPMTNNDQDLTQVYWGPNFIAENLEPLHLNSPAEEGANTGAWYHLFGVAYFELQARGTWGAYTLIQTSVDETGDRLTSLIKRANKIIANDPNLETPANQSLFSDLSNEIEQVARVYVFGSQKDPVKYCYNVWGAQLGAWLYNKKVQRKGLGLGLSLPKAPEGFTTPSIFGPITLPTNPLTKNRMPREVFSSSPISITWSTGNQKMMLDQKTKNLWGFAPFHLLPYYEESTDSFGVKWTELSEAPYVLEMEATQTAWAHITLIDGNQNSAIYVYPMFMIQGEKFQLIMDSSSQTPSPIMRQNGEFIEAILVKKNPPPPNNDGNANEANEDNGNNSGNSGNNEDNRPQVVVYGSVLDNQTNKPIKGALVTILKTGFSISQWVENGFTESMVEAHGMSDDQGRFSLSKNLSRESSFSLYAIHIDYQTIQMDNLRIGKDTPEPVKISIKMKSSN